MNYQRAEGENGIFPGKRIVIKAVDSRFSGTWLVERVVHDIGESKGGFTTTVYLKRNKSGDDNDRGSDRSVSAIDAEMVASEEGEGEAEKEEKKTNVGKTCEGIPLSKNNIQHIKKHTFLGIKEQAKFLTDKQLADKLSAKSFFNKNWSNEDVIKYTQEAYNILISQGKTGLQSIIVNNEVIKVFIKNDGSFDSAYGIYKYGINDFR